MSKTESTSFADPSRDWALGKPASEQPRCIGRYPVVERLGAGGMGEVYRVRDEKLNRDIALKVIRKIPDSNVEVRAVQEISILKDLNHDGIVHLLDEDIWEGQTYFTMELIDGLSLAQLMNKNKADGVHAFSSVRKLLSPLGPTQLLGGPLGDLSPDSFAYVGAIRIAIQIAVTLEYLHSKKIIHRDIKPSNILLKSNGRVFLTDFGIAHLPRDSGVDDLTKPGAFIGTDRYAAPEQHMGQGVTARTDVYGLGAVLYELVCSKQIFEKITHATELSSYIIHKQPQPPISLVPNIPLGLNEIIVKALSNNPSHRYPTAIAMAEALQKVTESKSEIKQVKKESISWFTIACVSILILFVLLSVIGIVISGIWYVLSHYTK